jgi:hypothetical protein
MVRVPVVEHKDFCHDCGGFLMRQVALPRDDGSVHWGGAELARWMVERGKRHYGPNPRRRYSARGGEPPIIKGPKPITLDCRCGASTVRDIRDGISTV